MIKTSINNQRFSVLDIVLMKLVSTFSQQIHPQLPKTIGNFHLDSELNSEQNKSAYSFACYKDEKGNRAIAKIWSGKVKDFNYWSLKNEATVYQAIAKLSLRNKKQLVYLTPNVRTPNLFHVHETGTQLLLLIEELPQKSLRGKSSGLTMIGIINAQKFMRALSDCILQQPKIAQTLAHRTHYDFVFVSIISFFKAIVIKPKLTLPIVKAFSSIMFQLPKIFRDRRQSLVHRSIEDQNILSDGKKFILIDFQLSLIAHPFTELAQTLIFSWSNEQLRKSLIHNTEYQKILKNGSDSRIFRCFLLQTALLQVAENVMPESQAVGFLQFALNHQDTHQVGGIPERLFFLWLNILNWFLRLMNPLSNKLNIWYWRGKKAIFCYHDISDSFWRFSTSATIFSQQLTHLSSIGSIVSLSELVNSKPSETPQFALTFDDGYSSVYTTAAPILKRNKLPATAFVLARPDLVNRSQLNNDLPLMNMAQVVRLANDGWEIGYHTAQHDDLRHADLATVKKDLITEKIRLEKIIGKSVKIFAYPRGGVSQQLVSTLRESGITQAFTTEGIPLPNLDVNRFKIPRIPLEGMYSMQQFSALLSPLGILSFEIFLALLRIKERLSRYTL